jgi:hypothetical protein
MRLLKAIAAAIGLVLLLWGTGCRHTYDHAENAYLAQSGAINWDESAAKHEEKQQHDETKETKSQVVYRKKTTPSPQGPIVEESYAVTLSELQATSGVVTASSSESRTAGSARFDNVQAISSSTKADTRAGVNPWWWLLLLVPVAAGGWALRKWIRGRIPFL